MKKYLLPLLFVALTAVHCTKDAEQIIRERVVTHGSAILSGSGAPDASKGEKGDYYLDITTSDLYTKTETGWGTTPIMNLRGLQGNPGTNGQDGQTPRIGDNGNWWVGNTDLNVRAQGNPGTNGQDGQTPRIGDNGNWWVGNTDLNVRAQGNPGRDGQNGQTPRIGDNGNWWVGNTDLNVRAQGNPGRDGQNGQTPRIGDNGNWWVGTEDTGKPARGAQGIPGANGQNGLNPHIGDNGNWWIGTVDTGKPARGAQGIPGNNGQNGLNPHIGDNGNWWVGTVDTGKPARGAQGIPGNNGQNGADGSKIYADNGTPTNSVGSIGDYYIDKEAKIFYGPKTATGWPTTGISLTGNPISTIDYELSSDGKTLVKWLNPKTSYIDMNLDPKLRDVTTIATGAFAAVPELRDKLSTVIIGDAVTEIQASAFAGCGALRRVELPEGLTTIAAFTFSNCINLRYINIPETVTSIKEQAFANCTKLKTITIPKGISGFESRTFMNCSALQTLILENPTAFEINKAGTRAFQGVTLNAIYVPYGSATNYKNLNKSGGSNFENIIKSIVIQ